MDPGSKRESEKAGAGRNYGGVRITTPPRRDDVAMPVPQAIASAPKLGQSGSVVAADQQARILTGSALFGVIVIVLLHEFGHWIAGFAVTGLAPDFLLVAVRQKVPDFSTAGGIVTWGAGPLVHITILWLFVYYVTSRSRTHPRLFAVTGGAIVFTLIVHLLTWASATFTSVDSWGNDVPRVATFFGSWARFWMHALSAGFMAAVLLAAYVWLVVARSTGRKGLFLYPSLMGAGQGAVLVLIATYFVSLSE